MLARSEDHWLPIQILLEIKRPQLEPYHSHILNYRAETKWNIISSNLQIIVERGLLQA
jgi:hypothetical protein